MARLRPVAGVPPGRGFTSDISSSRCVDQGGDVSRGMTGGVAAEAVRDEAAGGDLAVIHEHEAVVLRPSGRRGVHERRATEQPEREAQQRVPVAVGRVRHVPAQGDRPVTVHRDLRLGPVAGEAPYDVLHPELAVLPARLVIDVPEVGPPPVPLVPVLQDAAVRDVACDE